MGCSLNCIELTPILQSTIGLHCLYWLWWLICFMPTVWSHIGGKCLTYDIITSFACLTLNKLPWHTCNLAIFPSFSRLQFLITYSIHISNTGRWERPGNVQFIISFACLTLNKLPWHTCNLAIFPSFSRLQFLITYSIHISNTGRWERPGNVQFVKWKNRLYETGW